MTTLPCVPQYATRLIPDFVVSGEAKNGCDAIEKAESLRPDLIILDLAMPVMTGLDAAPVLRKMLPDSRLILLSPHDGPKLTSCHWDTRGGTETSGSARADRTGSSATDATFHHPKPGSQRTSRRLVRHRLCLERYGANATPLVNKQELHTRGPFTTVRWPRRPTLRPSAELRL